MKTAGIIAEYNPFHNGHKYHIEQTRRITGAECVIAVMSGNFVQRGEVAIFSKHSRARAAISGGADIVFELPAYFSLKSASGFALGAVYMLEALGVDALSFGAECGNIEELKAAGDILYFETEKFKEALKANLKKGMSFAAARAGAAENVFPEAACLLSMPNNILAIEYLNALKRLQSGMMPFVVKRFGAGHDCAESDGNIASASHIRKMYCENKDISDFVPQVICETPLFMKDCEKLILYALAVSSPDILKRIPDTGDGLRGRLGAVAASSLEELFERVKTKRFALSRIKRVVMNVLLQNTLAENLSPSYLRVLAMNAVGAKFLKLISKTTSLPIIIKPSAYKKRDPIWDLEIRATRIRNISAGGKNTGGLEKSPEIIM